jgi:hypothetical protein
MKGRNNTMKTKAKGTALKIKGGIASGAKSALTKTRSTGMVIEKKMTPKNGTGGATVTTGRAKPVTKQEFNSNGKMLRESKPRKRK